MAGTLATTVGGPDDEPGGADDGDGGSGNGSRGLDLVSLEVSIANLMSLGDPALVWTWSWRRFCAYWCRVMDEGARRRIEEEQRERKRRHEELLREARSAAGY